MNVETTHNADQPPAEELPTEAEEHRDDAERQAPTIEVVEEQADETELTVREAELTERLQRVAADYANYQKRVQREKAKWTQDSVRDLLHGLLPVLDNLDKAIEAFDGDVKDPGTYKQGVVLVRDELLHQLGLFQVERIETEKGAPFDPEEHQAIMVQQVEGIEQEAVSFQARTGYRLGTTVLRPAQVGVMKPKPPEAKSE